MIKKVIANSWGRSLGIRLPRKMVEELKIENGTELTVEMRGGRIIIYPAEYKPSKSDRVQEAIEILTETLPKSNAERKRKNV